MTALHLARVEDAERLLALIDTHHREIGLSQSSETLGAALMPLLEGVPHGVAYLLGPARAPVGYVVVAFGWSLEAGGMVGTIDELWIRPSVRGRGIGSEVLSALPRALGNAGLKALHLRLARDNPRARALATRMHFRGCDSHARMTRTL